MSGGCWLAMILVQKLPGKKTAFSKSLYFILNHQLLLCTGSTLFQRALDVAFLSHCFLEENFWKELSEVRCCAPSLRHNLVPSAPSCAFLAPPVCVTTRRAPQALLAPRRDFNSYLSLRAASRAPGQRAEYCKHFYVQTGCETFAVGQELAHDFKCLLCSGSAWLVISHPKK